MLFSWARSVGRRRRIIVPVHIPARKSSSAGRSIQDVPLTALLADELLVPLTLRPDLRICPAVKPGDRVRFGQQLSTPDCPGAVPALSPASGIVEALTTVDTQFAADLPAVRLRVTTDEDGRVTADGHASVANQVSQVATQPADVRDVPQALADLAKIEDLPATLDELGVVGGYANQPEPLGELLRRAAAARVDLLVVNAIQGEPRLVSDYRLLLDALQAVAAGARAIANYLSLPRTNLLVSASRPPHETAIRQLQRYYIRTTLVRTSFPGDAEPILLKRLFGRRIAAAGGCGLDARCLLLSVDAVWRVGSALLHRAPVLTQPITIAGDCLAPGRPGVYAVPIGLTISQLIRWLSREGTLREQPQTVILGGAMTGCAVTDVSRTVVDQTTRAVLLTHHRGHLQTTACIRCGWCLYGCPSGLDPIAILDALEAHRSGDLAHLAPKRCFGCNVCSYVCPSHLPLSQAVRTARCLLSTNQC